MTNELAIRTEAEVLEEKRVQRRMNAARVALGIPDVTPIDLDKLTVAELGTLANAFALQLAAVRNRLADLERPVADMRDEARKRIITAIQAAEGKKWPHDKLDILLTPQPGKRSNEDARIDELMALVDLVPADQLAPCLWVEHLEVRDKDYIVTPEVIEQAILGGCRAVWKCDLRKLDQLAADFGGQIAKIIAHATPRRPDGEPILTITPRESAIKKVGNAKRTG